MKQNKKNNDTKNTKSIFFTSKVDKVKPSALKVANIVSNSPKELVEASYLQDNTIAYKWARAYNGVKYSFDFILVVLDEDDNIARISKKYLSKLPDNEVSIDISKAKESALQELKNRNLSAKNLNSSEIQIVNLQNEDFSFNTNTKYAYGLNYSIDDKK